MGRGIFAAGALALCSFSFTAGAEAPPEQAPRFLSLKEEAPGRASPRGAVQWIYQRQGLPLQALEERGGWVHVRDPGGEAVWMEAGSLEPLQTAYVLRETALRRTPSGGARVIAYLEPGVIGAVTACDRRWRRVSVRGRVGWVSEAALWGGGCAGATE